MDALQQLKTAIAKTPDDPALHYDLGGLYLAAQQHKEAIAAYQTALYLAPNHPQILLQLGNCYSADGRYQEAVKHFNLCLQADPNNDAAHFNLANALRELGRPQEAAASYRKAIKLNPKDADAHNNLGNVLRELGQLDAAIASYETALQINPNLHHAKVHLVHQKQHICDWQGLEDDVNSIRAWVNTTPHAQISPFAFFAMPDTTASEQLKCSSNWLNTRYSNLIKLKNNLNYQHQKKHKNKLRIGYLSADFRLHPLAFLITDLIEQHNREQFEVHAYSYGANDNSDERNRFEQAFDQFNDIQSLNLIESANKIYADKIDILVDLTGFTQTSRSGIAALKPATIQVNWLGFPGSMGKWADGSALFDYIISDDFITPPQSTNDYAETIITLPCYQPNNQRPTSPAPSRAECGLPEGAFVFCCFNQTFKILPQMFDIWMRLLKATPNSVLWLIECNPWAKANLFKEAKLRGVSSNQLVFAPRVNLKNHLARHIHADLFLDTLPYNAHTTCSDALWMGVPVLSCVGETFASRVAGSLLNAAELPELICSSLAEYEARALQLAANPAELSLLKGKINTNKQIVNLFNTANTSKTLEQAYTKIWQNFLSV